MNDLIVKWLGIIMIVAVVLLVVNPNSQAGPIIHGFSQWNTRILKALTGQAPTLKDAGGRVR